MIGIIGFANLNIIQYLFKYTNILDELGAEYEVIYWDRLGIDEPADFKGGRTAYRRKIDSHIPFYKKIGAFLGYSRFLRRMIKKRKYDKLIVLLTQPAIITADMLLGRYRGRFIYDYRDSGKEAESGAYLRLVNKLIDASWITMISSPGYAERFGFDKSKLCMSHNTRTRLEAEMPVKTGCHTPVRLVYWGSIRHTDYIRRICDAFGKDPRFELTFHGSGKYKELQQYCAEKGYDTVTFTGGYYLDKIPSFAENTDIINCAYDDLKCKNSPRHGQDLALAVKLYDAVRFRLPIALNKGFYILDYINNAEFAFPLDLSEPDACDKLYDRYINRDTALIEKRFSEFQRRVNADDDAFYKKLAEFAQL